MLIELNYVFLNLLLVIYSSWHYLKRKNKYMLDLTLCLTFLTLSAALQLSDSLIWVYQIPASITVLRILEVGGLGLYACFTICAIMTLRKIRKLK